MEIDVQRARQLPAVKIRRHIRDHQRLVLPGDVAGDARRVQLPPVELSAVDGEMEVGDVVVPVVRDRHHAVDAPEGAVRNWYGSMIWAVRVPMAR